MAKSSTVGISGEYVTHTAGVRMRLQGSGPDQPNHTGLIEMSLFSLDNAREYVMKPLVTSMTPGIEPTRLANFRSQRTLFQIKTTRKDDFMRVQRIIIFMKPSATSLPM